MLDAKANPDDVAMPSVERTASGNAAPAPVLIILHQEASTSGRIGAALGARGHALDIRRPRFGDPMPATLRHHAGAVIFGGPMSANDPDDYLRREIELIELALKEERPYLGVCLGAQLMALALGAHVTTHPQGYVEIGYHPLTPLPAAERFGGTWPDAVYQWHREGFGLPPGAVRLATASGPFAEQAFSFGPAAIGVQFHPEINHAMVCRWSGRNEHRLGDPGAQSRVRQIEDHVANGPAVASWLDRFLADWLKLAVEPARTK